MRIVLNGLTALKPRTGIGQYTARLAAELTLLQPGNFFLYPPEQYAKLARRFLSKPAAPGCDSNRWTTRLRATIKSMGRVAMSRHMARFCSRNKIDLYHEPNYLPLADAVPVVITIHDLSVILHPEWHPADRVKEHIRKLERAVATAVHIITDTEQVKRELIREMSVAAERVTAIHLGVTAEFRPSPRLYGHEYFLCVGTIEPRKNLLTAMRAYATLPAPMREKYPLLLAGPWGWRAEKEHEYFQKYGNKAGIRHLGYVSDSDLPGLYSGAAALLYPSLYEGFGLPPLEAAACGAPAICSRQTHSVREVMGENAVYCDPHDIDAWRQAMLDSLDAPRRPFPAPSWATTAEQTLAVYGRALGPSLVRAAA